MAPARKSGRLSGGSANSNGPAKSKSVQPMITSLLTRLPSSKPLTKSKPVIKTDTSRKGTASLAGRKRTHGEMETDDEAAADTTLVEVVNQTHFPDHRGMGSSRTAAFTNSNVDSPRTSEADRALIGTPPSIIDRLRASPEGPTKVPSHSKSFPGVHNAWEGQHPMSSSNPFGGDGMRQSHLHDFGIEQHLSKRPHRAEKEKPNFAIDFDAEEDLDFDELYVPSSQTPAPMAVLSPPNGPLRSSRSPSPSLLSPVKPSVLRTHPRATPLRVVESAFKTILPSSQTQQLSPLSPVVHRSPVLLVPSSQTQQFDPLSPVSHRRQSQAIDLHTLYKIPSDSPVKARPTQRPAPTSPDTLHRIPSSQEGERAALLTPVSKRAHPTLAQTSFSQVSVTSVGNQPSSSATTRPQDPPPPVPEAKATQYYTESVPFTLPPSSVPSQSSNGTSLSSIPDSLTRSLLDVLDEGEADTTRRLQELEQGRFGHITSGPAQALPTSLPMSDAQQAPYSQSVPYTVPPSLPSDSATMALDDDRSLILDLFGYIDRLDDPRIGVLPPHTEDGGFHRK